jgi:mono/diheme cytochrome c family protein
MRCSPQALPALALLVILPGSLFGITPALRPQEATQGQSLFQTKCAVCHTVSADRLIGPGLQGVADRRERAWLVAFIANPDQMVAEGDSLAVRLLEEYGMPMPNLGLTEAEAESIVDYLAVAEATTADESRPLAALPEGDPVIGSELFTGERSLENRGAACISCHDVAALGPLGGGSLAKDLTLAGSAYGSSLAALLETPPYPAMQAVYGSRPLTRDEVANLSAFLTGIDESEASTGSRFRFLAAGLGGMILLAGLAGVMWRGRLREVRKALIGERQ